MSTLVEQFGPDTVSRWERAAPARVADAGILFDQKRHLAAVYLYGYAIEMWIKAAYFRAMRYGPHVAIVADARSRIESRARQANLMSRDPHDLAGWARILVDDRQRLLNKPYPAAFGIELVDRALAVYDNW